MTCSCREGSAILWSLGWSRHFQVSQVEAGERAYFLAGQWAASPAADRALLVANQVSGALVHYSNRPFVATDHLTPERAALLLEYANRHHLALHAVLFDHEEQEVLRRKLPGNWEPTVRLRQITVWRLVPDVSILASP